MVLSVGMFDSENFSKWNISGLLRREPGRRSSKFHFCLLILFSLYLAPSASPPRFVLDLLTGSGIS